MTDSIGVRRKRAQQTVRREEWPQASAHRLMFPVATEPERKVTLLEFQVIQHFVQGLPLSAGGRLKIKISRQIKC